MPRFKKPRQIQTKRAASLQYDEKVDLAPKITALGFGHVADRIVEIAKTHGVPIHQDPYLSNLLTQLDIGQYIPPELYKLVAEVLVFVYYIDKQKGLQNELLQQKEMIQQKK